MSRPLTREAARAAGRGHGATLPRPAGRAARGCAAAIPTGARRAGSPPPRARPRVLLTTEGTYPYAIGGVCSWCDLLGPEPRRSSTGRCCRSSPPHGRPPLFELPAHARQVGRIELWSEALPEGRHAAPGRAPGRHASCRACWCAA